MPPGTGPPSRWRYLEYFCVPDALFPHLTGVESHDRGMDYLPDLRNFADIKDVIRSYFTPHLDLWARLSCRFDEMLALPHKTSLHVRRGDYLGHNGFSSTSRSSTPPRRCR
jgi:hypothetical protein